MKQSKIQWLRGKEPGHPGVPYGYYILPSDYAEICALVLVLERFIRKELFADYFLIWTLNAHIRMESGIEQLMVTCMIHGLFYREQEFIFYWCCIPFWRNVCHMAPYSYYTFEDNNLRV